MSISWTVVWVKSSLEACVLWVSSSVDLESHFPRCPMSRMVLLTTKHLPAWLSCQSFSQDCSLSRYIRILNKGIFLFCLFVCISLVHPHIVAEETPTPTPTQKVFASGWTYFGLTWNLVESRFGKYLCITPPGFLYGLSADRLGGALKKILRVVVVFMRSRLAWLAQPR